MNINEIIKVETLPKIYQQLEQLSVEIDNEVNNALSLECNENSKVEVKKARANLNKIKTEVEDRRKFVKEQILQPYMNFEKVYNELIKDKLVYADETLKNRINEIEKMQKLEKEDELMDYFNEYRDSIHLEDIIQWEQLEIKVNLSDSDKKLREQVKSKLDNIANDIKLIELEEYPNEIYVEYLKDFDFAKAKLTVYNRLKEIQEIQEHILSKEQYEQIEEVLEQKVEDEIIVPTEAIEEIQIPKDIFTTTFQVTGTKKQLIDLKEYMIKNHLDFKNL